MALVKVLPLCNDSAKFCTVSIGSGAASFAVPRSEQGEIPLATLVTKVQGLIVMTLIVMLVLVVLLSTAHLGWLIAHEMWQPPRILIPVQGLIEIFGYFLLVLIGVELLETLKVYLKQDVIHVRVVIEVALIAMARKVITAEPNNVAPLTLFGIAALILALAVAFYFERQTSGNGAKD